MRLTAIFAASALSLGVAARFTLPAQPLAAPQITPPTSANEADRATAHSSPVWQLIAPHLPDPLTATPEALEQQGDLLRVRRFPEDALDYYGYALKRGGNQPELMNKIGVTQLEMGNVSIARAYFQRALKLQRNNAFAWNNLGAVEFMNSNYVSALRDYKRAIKFNKKSAVYHSNLGLAYVEVKDFPSAKSELMAALRLDPEIFQHAGAGGVSLHMLSTTDHANFCFQMAKVYARMGNEPEMIHSLETAAEAGMDVRSEMRFDSDLARYVTDPRVITLARAAKSLHDSHIARNTVASALPPASQPAAPSR